jgi:signal transduction histidine kinase
MENAVRNALDAMPDGGTLEVCVSAELSDGDPRVLLRIRDDGEGMDARICERVFDDFFTTKSCGSGLGLAFVRRVAEAHGGDVSLTSQLGRGTELALRLPLPASSSDAPWSSWGPVSTQPA